MTIIIVMSLLFIVGGSLFFFLQSGSKKNAEKVSEILEQSKDPTVSSVPVTGQELDLILKLLEVPSQNQEVVYQTLSVADSTDQTDIAKKIAETATQGELNSETRVRLFQILEQRQEASALPLLANYFSTAKDESSVVAAIKASQPVLTENKVTELFKLISFSESPKIQTAAEIAIKEFTNSNPKSRIGSELTKAYKAAKNPTAKKAYLRLLGSSGNISSREVLAEALKSEDDSLRISAYRAIGDWPDSSMFSLMFDALTSEPEGEIQTYGFNTVANFLTKNEEMKNATLLRHWKRLVDEAKNDKQKAQIIQSLGQQEARWTIPILQYYLEDNNDDITYLAELELDKLNML